MSLRTLCLLLMVGCLLGAITAAPAPRKKPAPPPPPHVGTWAMHWRGGVFRTTFAADGSYQCGTAYAGSWVLRNGVLEVEEFSEHDHYLHWIVNLFTPTTGTLGDDGSEWKLEPSP
jgi:hypothetical protein